MTAAIIDTNCTMYNSLSAPEPSFRTSTSVGPSSLLTGSPIPDSAKTAISLAVLSLRFFNCEMYFHRSELDILERALRNAPLKDRVAFFEECLRLRRR